MARFFKIPQSGHEGKITYGNGIIEDIVILAVSELEYVELCSVNNFNSSKRNAIKVRQEKDGVYVEVSVKIHYSQSVSETAFKIQETIRHNFESMTEYKVLGVDVKVNDVMFDEVVPQQDTTENDA